MSPFSFTVLWKTFPAAGFSSQTLIFKGNNSRTRSQGCNCIYKLKKSIILPVFFYIHCKNICARTNSTKLALKLFHSKSCIKALNAKQGTASFQINAVTVFLPSELTSPITINTIMPVILLMALGYLLYKLHTYFFDNLKILPIFYA